VDIFYWTGKTKSNDIYISDFLNLAQNLSNQRSISSRYHTFQKSKISWYPASHEAVFSQITVKDILLAVFAVF